MPHGPGEAPSSYPVKQRGRPKPKVKIRTIKHAPAKPSTVVHRATGGKHVSPQIKRNIVHAKKVSHAAATGAPLHPQAGASTKYLKRRKEFLRHKIAVNERRQAKIAAQLHAPVPKIKAFKAPKAPKVPHPKLARLQDEHTRLTNELGRTQIKVATRQEEHPENIPIIGSPNTSTADALLLAASLAPIGEAAGAGIKAAGAGLKGTKAAEVAAKATGALKAGPVGRVVSRASKALKKPAPLKTAEQDAAKALRGRSPSAQAARAEARTTAARGSAGRSVENVTARAVGRRVRGVARRGARGVVHTPTVLAEKTTRVPFGPQSQMARLIGPTSAKGLGAAAFPIKADYLAKAGSAQLQGAVEDPGQTLRTTARVAEQFPAAAVAPLSAVYSSISSGSTKPLEAFVSQTADYGKLFADLAGPRGVQITKTKLGLIPTATLALGVRAAEKPVHGKLVGAGKKVRARFPDAVTKDLRIANDLKRSDGERLDALTRVTEYVRDHEAGLSAHAGRKRSAVQRAAQKAEVQARVRNFGIDAHRTKRSFAKKLAKADRHKVTENITEADLIHYLGPRGLLGEDSKFILGQVRGERARLGKTPTGISPLAKHDRMILDAIIANPKVLESPRIRDLGAHGARIQRAVSIERHTEETGRRQTTVSPADEAVRLQHVARQEGIPLPHETAPHALRDLTHPRNGRPLFDAQGRRLKLSSDSKALAKAGDVERALKARAKAYGREAKILEERAKAGGPKAEQTAIMAARYRDVAERINEHVGLHERARGKLIEASRIEQGKAAGDPRTLRAEAAALTDLANTSAEARFNDYVKAVNAAIARKPYSEPFYVKETSAAERSLTGPMVREQWAGAGTVAKEKRRTGALAETGATENSARAYLDSILRNQEALSQRELGRRFIASDFQKVDGRRIFTSDELDRLLQEGKLDPNGGPIPVADQRLAPTFQRSGPLRAERDAASIRAEAAMPVSEIEKGSARLYGWGRSKAAWDEFKAQSERNTSFTGLKRFGRAQSALILASSPVWFTLQLAASPLWLAYSHPNPLEWVKAGRAMKELKKLPPDARSKLEGVMGATGVGTGVEQITFEGIKGADVAGTTARALRVAQRSPVGRLGSAIRENLRGGGPLIRTNQAFESKVRALGGLMESERLLKDLRNAKVKRFAAHTQELTDLVARQSRALEKVPKTERAKWLADRPAFHDELATRLERALGSWNHLSTKERGVQAAVIFYPFMRASIRWFMWTAPLHTPLRYALLANLAQSNNITVDEIAKRTGSSSPFLTQYGEVPLYGPDGEVTHAINLYRISPGGNTLLEAIGTGKFDLPTLTGFVQPAFGIAATAAAGQTPYGTISTVSKPEQLGLDILNLNPITRAAIPRSSISRLFSAMGNKPTGFGTLNPFTQNLLTDLSAERRTGHLSRLLDAAGYSKNDEHADVLAGTLTPQQAHRKRQKAITAQGEINKLLVRYGIDTKAAQERETKKIIKRSSKITALDYKLRYPGERPSSSSANPFATKNPLGASENPFAAQSNPFK